MVKQIALLGFASMMLTACGSPRSALDKAIQDQNFIPFEMPMPSTRVGTMIHGNNNEIYLAATPDECFPDMQGNKSLRFVQDTDLPSQYQNLQFGFDASISPVLGAGNAVVNFNFGLNYVKTVQLQFNHPSIEFLNESAFRSYFNDGMSAYCKGLLANYPFIVQGLRIESMSFSFQDQTGAQIALGGIISQLANFAPGVKWQIQNNYTLVVETPKYIGYRLAAWDGLTGLNLQYASSTDQNGNWLFKDVDQPVTAQEFLTQGLRPAESLP